MTKLVIDRQRWLRGEGSGDSCLRRERDGKMCCLGFYCIEAGFTEEDITEKSTPVAIAGFDADMRRLAMIDPLLRNYEDEIVEPSDSELCEELTVINDQQESGETEREARISEKFAEMGVTVEFIN